MYRMKLNAVKENKYIKINSNHQILKRLGISGAVCLLLKQTKSFCIIEVFARGQFAIESSLSKELEVEYV